MDRINNYIQDGKILTGNKLFSIFLLIGCLFAGIFYAFTSVVINGSDIQTVLKEIPTITIKDGIVQSPKAWEKELPHFNVSLAIDNTSDTPKVKKKNMLYLGRTKYIMIGQGATHEYLLKGFSSEITANDILNYLKKGIVQTALVIGVFILLFLYLGFYGTYFLSRLIIRLLKKDIYRDIIKRASFIGWISVTILNLILIFFNGGLGLLVSIPTASVIAVFCVLKGKNEQDF